MKRILLIQLPTSHHGSKEIVYPLGLSRLSSLIPDSEEAHALDMNLYPDPWPELKNKLEKFKPEIVFVSFRNLDPLAGRQSSYLSSIITGSALIKHIAPSCRLIAGGPAFSLFAKRLMEEIVHIDFGVVGEAEPIMPSLLNDRLEPLKIPGLVWRDETGVHCNKRSINYNLDELPSLNPRLFCPAEYIDRNGYIASIGIEGKRGCRFHCAYCVYPRISGDRVRLREPARIVDEMEVLHNTYGIRLFHFTDPTLNDPLEHFNGICREILLRRLKVQWTGFLRENNITDESLEQAVKAGLCAAYFSGDALNEFGLALLGKKLSISDIFAASRRTCEHGLLTVCHFLVNLPLETEDHRQETLKNLDMLLEIHQKKGNLGAVIFNNIRLYPDAPLTQRLMEQGLASPRIDLLRPQYFNPPETSDFLNRLEVHCHRAGVFSRLFKTDDPLQELN